MGLGLVAFRPLVTEAVLRVAWPVVATRIERTEKEEARGQHLGCPPAIYGPHSLDQVTDMLTNELTTSHHAAFGPNPWSFLETL